MVREEEHSYRRNNVFEVVRDECTAVRERVGLIDLTGFAKYDVTGADAEAFLNRVLANRMPRRDGGIALAHFLSKNGRILGEATVTRFLTSTFTCSLRPVPSSEISTTWCSRYRRVSRSRFATPPRSGG